MMTSLRGSRCLLAILTLLGLEAPAYAGEEANDLPRYRLKVGQELRYHAASDFTYEKEAARGSQQKVDGEIGETTDWQVWVVQAHPNGGWRLVVRSSEKLSRRDRFRRDPKTPLDAARAMADFFDNAARDARQKANPPEVRMAYFDLFPDGRIVGNDSLGFHLDPSPLFPRLPQDARQAQQGWDDTVRIDSHMNYKSVTSTTAGTAPEGWGFEGVDTSPSNRIYLMTFRSRYEFDRRRGLLKRSESENTQGYGFVGKGTGTLELTAVVPHDTDQTRTLAEESDRYFSARKTYHELLTTAEKHPGRVDALLAQAEAVLKDARTTLSLPILKEQADHDLGPHKRMISYLTRQAQNHADLLGHAAADWETTDLASKPHSLKDYRGKVVILDFWYRGCGWCIRAMPQIKELAVEFKDEPVAVLGMNTDTDEKDAQFVVDELKLNYPVLKAEGLPEKYKVNTFPTLIIIDQEGKVADVHVGYTPTLRDEVAKAVRELLGRK